VLSSFANARPFIQQGKMKSLAAASLNRVAALPDATTVAEFGFPGHEERSWVGIFVSGEPSALMRSIEGNIRAQLPFPRAPRVAPPGWERASASE